MKYFSEKFSSTLKPNQANLKMCFRNVWKITYQVILDHLDT